MFISAIVVRKCMQEQRNLASVRFVPKQRMERSL